MLIAMHIDERSCWCPFFGKVADEPVEKVGQEREKTIRAERKMPRKKKGLYINQIEELEDIKETKKMRKKITHKKTIDGLAMPSKEATVFGENNTSKIKEMNDEIMKEIKKKRQ